MDGTPIFNLFKDTLHGNKIIQIKGILNGTSNYVLTQLENGASYEVAIKEAQEMGLAEANPSMDIDGLDGAAKICVLANVLMGANINPKMVEITSMCSVTREDILLAKQEGYKIKYICEAVRDYITNEVKLKVYLKKIEFNDTYCSVNGTSAAITLITDLAGEITIIQTNPHILQTAYGIYSDLLTVIKSFQY
jgi:homoserine dehydrogenase